MEQVRFTKNLTVCVRVPLHLCRCGPAVQVGITAWVAIWALRSAAL